MFFRRLLELARSGPQPRSSASHNRDATHASIQNISGQSSGRSIDFIDAIDTVKQRILAIDRHGAVLPGPGA